MSKSNIKISDFNMFYEVIKSLSKMSGGIKFEISDCGLSICAKNEYSKCEVNTNAISSGEKIDFCVADIGMLLKILTTLKELYKDDYSNVKMYYDLPFIRFESGKFKTKIHSDEEEKILQFIGKKVHTQVTPQLEFITSSSLIKSINSHSFIFQDSSSARIYITTEDDMQNNTIFATLGNEENDLANSATLELGLVSSGTLTNPDTNEKRRIVIDFNRLNVLNILPSDEIKVSIAKEKPVMWSSIRKTGENNTFLNFDIYSFMMVR